MQFVFELDTIRQIGLLMLATLKWRMQAMLSSSLDKFGYGTPLSFELSLRCAEINVAILKCSINIIYRI